MTKKKASKPLQKSYIAKTSFLHPITKKRVLHGAVVTDTEGIPGAFLSIYLEEK